MKELIRKIIKESIDELDWLDTNPSLYNLISDFFKHEHPEYQLKKDFAYTPNEVIFITDGIDNYIYLEEDEFTIENIRKQLQADIIDLKQSKRISIMNDYINLAKVLEPIIGPINID